MNEFPLSTVSSRKNYQQTEIVWFLSDVCFFEAEKVRNWLDIFPHITIAAPSERPGDMPSEMNWFTYLENDYRSKIWNDLLLKSKREWVLFLIDDEAFQIESIQGLKLSDRIWAPALIQHKISDTEQRAYYQIRLIQNVNAPIFNGKNFPDCTQYITTNPISLSGDPIRIGRASDPIVEIDFEDELSTQCPSPQLYLMEGEHLLRKGKYAHAAANYRKVLKFEQLLPFDRLAAVNGLASCLTEQFKWQKAIALAQKSLEVEPIQKLPYLIRYRIYQLQQNWDEALTALEQYYSTIDRRSKANFDKSIDEKETLLKLTDLCLKAGYKHQALNYLEELFEVKKGKIKRSLIYKTLLLSIELNNYEKSVLYFSRMFGEKLDEGFSGRKKRKLNNIMELFIQNGWHEYVSEIYSQLYHHDPWNNEFKRRLIASLTKANRIEQARKLIAS